MIKSQETIAGVVIRKLRELVEDAVKDCNGGLLPTQKELRKLLKREVHPDGSVFHFKGRPILFIAPHRFEKVDGEMQLQIPHRKLYVPEPEQPLAASN